VLAIAWSPLISRFESIYQGINAMICYVAPPISAVFIWGVFWKRASSKAAFATLAVGSFLGLVVFLLDWYKDRTPRLVTYVAETLASRRGWELPDRLYSGTGWNIQFMMASFYLFVICSVILVAGSLAWPHRHTEQSEKLVWKHPWEALRDKGWPGIGNYKLLAAVLFIVMVALYIKFA